MGDLRQIISSVIGRLVKLRFRVESDLGANLIEEKVNYVMWCMCLVKISDQMD